MAEKVRYMIRHGDKYDAPTSGPFRSLETAEQAAVKGVASGLPSRIVKEEWHNCRHGQSGWYYHGSQCGGCGDRF